MTPLLEVQGLAAGYGRMPVLHDIDLTIEAGSITTVLGALCFLAGALLLLPRGGELDVARPRPRAARAG